MVLKSSLELFYLLFRKWWSWDSRASHNGWWIPNRQPSFHIRYCSNIDYFVHLNLRKLQMIIVLIQLMMKQNLQKDKQTLNAFKICGKTSQQTRKRWKLIFWFNFWWVSFGGWLEMNCFKKRRNWRTKMGLMLEERPHLDWNNSGPSLLKVPQAGLMIKYYN